MTTKLEALKSWVDQVASHTQPEAIHWCSGSDEEYQDLIELMLAHGTLTTLNKTTHPNCYLHLSNPNDVARVEHLTFVCTPEEKDAGPNNLWMPPADGHEQMDALFEGCMKGRIMYVIPYCMGPIASPYSRCGVEITDSPYVVVNMKLMTRMGRKALERIEKEIDASSCTSRKNSPSRVTARVMGATRYWAKSAMRCVSPVTRPARKAGSRSIC
jgi:phosphoenolpyruvate carboxykinase (GTP)